MRHLAALALVLVASVVAGCGGDDGQATRTVVQTVTVAPPAAPPPAATTPTDAAAEQPSLEPLPDGVIGADGAYAMTVRGHDYDGENISVSHQYPNPARWTFETQCTGSDCTILMRREYKSGVVKTLTLRPSDRPNVFETTSAGTNECVLPPRIKVTTKQRYSVKLSNPTDFRGRQTASKIIAFLNETTNGCTIKPSSATVSWNGTPDR